MRILLVRIAGLAVLALTALGSSAPPRPEDVELRDIGGHEVAPLRDARHDLLVLLFVRIDCPISNRYAPEMRRLYDEYSSRGVDWWLVFTDPATTPETAAAHMEEYALPLPALLDSEHRLVEWAGATVTPQAVVARRNGEVLYRGRIDDLYVSLGRARARPTRHDLREVLEAVLAGRPVEQRESQAIGCYIAPL